MGFRAPLPVPLGASSFGTEQGGYIGYPPPFWLVNALPEGTKDVSGGVQSDDAIVAGVVTKIALKTLSGTVQAQDASVSGAVQRLAVSVNGAVQADDAIVSGTVTPYPLTGWDLVDFTVNYSGLDPDSPFTDPIYSAIVIGDKAHFEVLTDPDGHTVSMDGLGEFSISPEALPGPQTFDVQVYDASDQTFGTISTITVYGTPPDEFLSGAVQADDATVSGAVERAVTSSGAVQADNATVSGNLNIGGTTFLFGGVSSGEASVSGTLEREIKSLGAVQSQDATVSGDLNKVAEFFGNVFAQRATMGGSLVSGDVIVTPNVGAKKQRNIGKGRIKRKIRIKRIKR